VVKQPAMKIGNEISCGCATLVVNAVNLQAKVLRLENLGVVGKWYGQDLN
jgi:hypothetical protein